MEKVTEAMKAMLDKPLPQEAVRPHPTKSFLSTINSIYVTERLNDVFGVGGWTTQVEIVDKSVGKTIMVVVKTTLEVPAYGIHYESYGGNDNADLGDAFKGAVTDALTKIGSWMGIGADVWKDKSTNGKQQAKPAPAPAPAPVPSVDDVIKAVYKCKTVAAIEDTFRKYPMYKKDEKLIAACRAAKSFLETPQNTKQ